MRMQTVKYGVVQRCSALQDLLDWDYLYVAGRLHKPVLTLKECPLVAAAQRHNAASAVAVALLLLPQRFSWDSMMHKLCSLSYRGVLSCACSTLRTGNCHEPARFNV